MGKHFKGGITLAFVVSCWYRHHPQPSGADVGWLESAKAVLTLLQCHLPSALTQSSQLPSGQTVLVSGWYYPTFNMPQNFILAWHITECLNLFYLFIKFCPCGSTVVETFGPKICSGVTLGSFQVWTPVTTGTWMRLFPLKRAGCSLKTALSKQRLNKVKKTNKQNMDAGMPWIYLGPWVVIWLCRDLITHDSNKQYCMADMQ